MLRCVVTVRRAMLRCVGARFLRVCLLVSALANSLLLLKMLSANDEAQKCKRTPSPLSPSPPNISALPSPSDLQQVIFVGGVPRSGTTLVRVMLDSHPSIRCGEETRVIPRILGMRSRWDRSELEHKRLVEAGLSGQKLDQATRAFITSIILSHGSPAKYLCNKDPLVLNYMNDVSRLYPKAKIILMIRDGRAVAYSIVSRNVTISGVNNKNYMSAAMFWNKMMTRMTRDCYALGSQRCLSVYYEELVTRPEKIMRNMLEFLNVPWHENVLHHHQLINKEVSLSKLELSSNQVKEPINVNAVDKWRTKLPLSIRKSIYEECDMLKELGYPAV